MEKKVKSELIYDGRVVKLYKDDVLVNEDISSIREYVVHPGGVCILGFVDDKIIMEKQFRYPYQKEILELPAGKLEPNEDPLEAAKREFEEETGYVASSLISLGEMYPTVAYTNEVIHMYFAKDLTKGKKHFDFDESLELVYLSLEETLDMIRRNEINDAKTICAIYKYLDLLKNSNNE